MEPAQSTALDPDSEYHRYFGEVHGGIEKRFPGLKGAKLWKKVLQVYATHRHETLTVLRKDGDGFTLLLVRSIHNNRRQETVQ